MAEIRVEPCGRWVRAWSAGKPVVDTRRARYVYGSGAPFVVWFVPKADVDPAALAGGALAAGLRERPDVGVPELADHLELVFDPFDRVTEEEESVYLHPRDPLHRVDALPSRRRVEVTVDGQVVAGSDRTVVVFETTHVPRYYFAWSDVRTELLVPSDTQTTCPYKGFARYWSLQGRTRLRKDLVWSYPATFAGAEAIAGRLCFYAPERCEIVVDGTVVPRGRA